MSVVTAKAGGVILACVPPTRYWMTEWGEGGAHSQRGGVALGPGTDLGQTGRPTPADGQQMFVTGLQAGGISREQIRPMGWEVPGAPLMGKG